MSELETAPSTWHMPRLTRINRLPRTLGFAATFVVLSWLTVDQGWSLWNVLFASLFFLVYPQLVYWFDYWRRAQSSIEYRAMMFDALLLGFWTAHIEFSALIAFTLLATVVLNNTMTGGARQCVLALGWFGLGLLVAMLSTGFNWSPAAPLPINVFMMSASLIYIFSVALAFNAQNLRLLRIKRSVEQTNSVFQSMLTLTELTDRTDDFENLVALALIEVQRLYPGQSFGFVLKDPAANDDVHFAAFTDDLAVAQQNQIRTRVAAIESEFPDRSVVDMGLGQARCLLYPLTERFGHFRGILIVQGSPGSDDDGASLPLVIKQLGTAISNKLLAMELQVAAERDALTGIYNRGQLDAELARAQARQEQDEADHFAVLLVDLIGLKGINDQFGHAAGDQLIREAAKALQDTCRDSDRLFRFGGDEFVILCNDESGVGAQALLKRIRTHVHGRQITLETTEGEAVEVVLALSVGLASSDQMPPEDVLQLADKRMYEQKEQWYTAHGGRRPSGVPGYAE